MRNCIRVVPLHDSAAVPQRDLDAKLGLKNHRIISDLELGKMRIIEEMSEWMRKVLGSHLNNEFGRPAE